jgi:predicted small secreted protein
MEKTKKFAQGLAIGSSIGLVAGIAANHYYRKKQKMSPDKVLDQIKAAFLKEGPIEGSWISFDTEHMQKFAITMDVLSGGITRTEDNQLIAYEFKADAKTGAVLSIDRILSE